MSNADKNWKNKVETSFDEDLIIYEGHKVSVADVSVGQEIITKWTRSGRVAHSFKVTDKVPCPGHNGLHVHINKSNCYDSRANIYVK